MCFITRLSTRSSRFTRRTCRSTRRATSTTLVFRVEFPSPVGTKRDCHAWRPLRCSAQRCVAAGVLFGRRATQRRAAERLDPRRVRGAARAVPGSVTQRSGRHQQSLCGRRGGGPLRAAAILRSRISGQLLDGDNDGTAAALGKVGETGKVACAGCHTCRKTSFSMAGPWANRSHWALGGDGARRRRCST